MRAPSWLSFGLGLSCFRDCNPGSSSNNQPTRTTGIETTEAFALPQTTAFQASDDLVASILEAPGSLELHGYTDVDLHGGIIGIYTERYSQKSQPVLELYIDTETQVLAIFENNLLIEEGETYNLQLYEIIQALCLERNIDIRKIKWAAIGIDEPSALTTIRDYRRNNGHGPEQDIKIAPADQSWRTFSPTHYYKSASRIVPGARVDRLIVASQKPVDTEVDQQAVIPEIMALSFKMLPTGDSAAIDSIDERAAELIAEDNLKAGLQTANLAFNAYMKEIWKTVEELEMNASQQPPKPTSNPAPGPA